ncbi:hypothetical protein A9Z06_33760 [Rhizobium sp. YK2]|nr:hypothetical protein A9Z06_33760 [Rhizobium sp. YK2]
MLTLSVPPEAIGLVDGVVWESGKLRVVHAAWAVPGLASDRPVQNKAASSIILSSSAQARAKSFDRVVILESCLASRMARWT